MAEHDRKMAELMAKYNALQLERDA